MYFFFQIAVVFFVGLIAYWWANQGLFSSLLHFICVVCAGALALAVWEPLVGGLALRNTFFDQYAWGFGLIGLFAISLALMRLAADKIAPANVMLPDWANLAFGGLLGVGSGIISIGILMIGLGMTQMSNEFMGVKLWTRENRGISNIHDNQAQSLWVPAHEWTARFYEFISAGSFYPEFTRQPMAKVYPKLDMVAFSLHRDSFANGQGRTTIVPEAVGIIKTGIFGNVFTVDIRVNNEAYDHAQQFTMSSAQVRVLAYEGGDERRGRVAVSHPVRWTQPTPQGPTRKFEFDDVSHFVTSIPGQSEVVFQLEFPIGNGDFQIPPGYIPGYIQIKGLRFRLPRPAVEQGRPSFEGTRSQVAPADPSAPMADANTIQVRSDIQPINASFNNIIGLSHQDRWLVSGEGTFRRGDPPGSRDARIHGVYATPGTKIVTVHVNRDSVASINGPVRERAGETAAPILVDSNGATYYAKGYIYETPDNLRIVLVPEKLIRTVGELPHLPTSNANRLRLLYEVTEGVTITSFRLGDITVCRANVVVGF